MPAAVIKRKRYSNLSQHSKVQQSFIKLATSQSHYENRNFSPNVKT